MQYPHAYHHEATSAPHVNHYHYNYTVHYNYGAIDTSPHTQHPLRHLVHAENLHPHHLYSRHPHYHSPVAHPSNADNHQVILPYHYSHNHSPHQVDHAGHILHFSKIVATSDVTKTHWVWHITDHRKVVVKMSEHIHSTFEECVRDARHYHSKLTIEHKDIEKTSWIWVITDHHGVLVKKSTTIHATFIKCVEDAHHHSNSHNPVAHSPDFLHQPGQAGHTLHLRKIIVTSDTTKVHWVWHISNHHKEVIKTSEHIHSSFEECIIDARQYDKKIIIKHKDIEKTSWAWIITDHDGVLVKNSTTIHATFIKCVDDLHHSGSY